ncbi:MAG: CinA family nicotinamide mononucleotide deamidase-related protein [Thermoguttaceae bacterium]|nr:CinA family nicotinamide mononucleotide deamidase-related protein [Thermoguttaceae bacterium]
MHAEIIAVGDEITSGQLLDTNSQWLALRLEELGIPVRFHLTVGDDREALAGVFRQAIARSDVVLVTGGLGPTADDLTRDALADATGRRLVLDAEALEHIRRLFARRNRPMPKQNERQALFPEGSRVIANAHGTAPGIDLDVPRSAAAACRVICLPGVPAEMREMWVDAVAGLLRAAGAGGRVIRHRRLKCFGAGESQIEAMLPDLIRRGRWPRVGINASQTTIILRITADGADEAECLAAMAPTVQTIRQCLGDLVFGEEDDELEHAVLRLLDQKSRTLATAEWGTAGTLAQWLGSADRDGRRYLGGTVLRSATSLPGALGLAPDLAEDPSPPREALAQAMASAVRDHYRADYGLAVGPFPRFAPEAPTPDRVFLGLAGPGGVSVRPIAFAGHPATLTAYCAKHALDFMRRELLK